MARRRLESRPPSNRRQRASIPRPLPASGLPPRLTSHATAHTHIRTHAHTQIDAILLRTDRAGFEIGKSNHRGLIDYSVDEATSSGSAAGQGCHMHMKQTLYMHMLTYATYQPLNRIDPCLTHLHLHPPSRAPQCSFYGYTHVQLLHSNRPHPANHPRLCGEYTEPRRANGLLA